MQMLRTPINFFTTRYIIRMLPKEQAAVAQNRDDLNPYTEVRRVKWDAGI